MLHSVTSYRGLFQIPKVNFAVKVTGCMCVCLVFLELLTRREGTILLVLFYGKVPVQCASIVLFRNIFEHIKIRYMMFILFLANHLEFLSCINFEHLSWFNGNKCC